MEEAQALLHCPAATKPPPLERLTVFRVLQGPLGAVLARWVSVHWEETTSG